MVNIYKHLTSEQIVKLKENNVVIEDKEYSDDDYLDIFDQVTDVLTLRGFDENYVANDLGIMMEDVIDRINDL